LAFPVQFIMEFRDCALNCALQALYYCGSFILMIPPHNVEEMGRTQSLLSRLPSKIVWFFLTALTLEGLHNTINQACRGLASRISFEGITFGFRENFIKGIAPEDIRRDPIAIQPSSTARSSPSYREGSNSRRWEGMTAAVRFVKRISEQRSPPLPLRLTALPISEGSPRNSSNISSLLSPLGDKSHDSRM
jgi:hypothetical protein